MAVERYGSSKTDVIVKLVLVFFISLLSFSIGTFVGKKFSDNQHKISQLEPQNATSENRDVASVNPEDTDVKPKDALNDEEIKKLAEEFVSDDEHKAEQPGTAEPKTEAAPTQAGETHESAGRVTNEKSVEAKTEAKPSTAAERIAAGKTPEPEQTVVATPEPARIPQSLPQELSSEAIGNYTVQVASYPTEAEAKKIAAGLKAQGLSAFYVSAIIKDKAANSEKTWYRVSVGVFSTQKEAENFRTDLLNRSKVSSAIVQKITK